MKEYTPRGKQVLDLAMSEARRRQRLFIGSADLLFGIIRLGECTALTVLCKMGVDLKALEATLEAEPCAKWENISEQASRYTPRAQRILALAQREAKNFDHSFVGTEHILLGLLAEGEGFAAQALKDNGVELARTRREVFKELDPIQNPPPSLSSEERDERVHQAFLAYHLSRRSQGFLDWLGGMALGMLIMWMLMRHHAF